MTGRLRNSVGMLFFIAVVGVGCSHKQPPPAPPAPPPAAPTPPAPAAPTITVNAEPGSIQSGGSTTLRWTSNNAVRVELNGAAVNLNGTQPETPTQSTDYQMVARAADGRTANATAHVTVSAPPPPPSSPPPPPAKTMSQLFQENVRDAFFDFDKYSIRTDAQQSLLADAQFLKSHPEVRVVIEGHCDDRGSAQYNMALGDRRANAVKDFLQQQGVDAGRITTVSYGKERPFCSDSTEDCYQSNRRGAVTPGS